MCHAFPTRTARAGNPEAACWGLVGNKEIDYRGTMKRLYRGNICSKGIDYREIMWGLYSLIP